MTLELELQGALQAQKLTEAARLALELGQHYFKAKQYDKAVDNFTLATRLCQELGDILRLIEALYHLADTYLMVDAPDKALVRIKRALELSVQLNYDAFVGKLWLLLGDSHAVFGKLDEALIDYQQASKYCQQLGQGLEAGLALGKQAMLLLDKDQTIEATLLLAQAIAYFEKEKRRDLQGQALGNLGTAFGRLGRWKEAGQRHTLALKIAREVGNEEEEYFQLSNLGIVAEMDGHPDFAIVSYRQALYLAIKRDDRKGIAHLCFSIARLLAEDTRQLAQATLLLEAAVNIAPHADTTTLLKELRQKQLRAGLGKQSPGEPNLKAYAEEAYRQLSS